MSKFIQEGKAFHRDRRTMLNAEQKAVRQAQREGEAAIARAEHEKREVTKYTKMEWLQAERLARVLE